MSAFKTVKPLKSSEPTQAAAANFNARHFDALCFQRMALVPLQPHTNAPWEISPVLPIAGLAQTFKTWLAQVPPISCHHFWNYSKKSRANGRKATSKPKSQTEQARHHRFPCFHCPKKFDSPKANAAHYKIYHKGILRTEPLFECTCGNFFNNVEDYKGHDCPRPPGQTAGESDAILIKKMKEKKKGR